MLLIVPSLDANKQWGGLVSTYYVARVECYERSFAKSAGNGTSTLNYAHYNKCIDDASWAFQHNLGGPGRGADSAEICWPGHGTDPVAVSRELLEKYRKV